MFKFVMTPATQALLNNYPAEFRKAIRIALPKAIAIAQEKVKTSFGGVSTPKVRSGKLRASIKVMDVEERSGQLISGLQSDVRYAAIQEFGGMAGRHRKVRIPARPYMGPGLEASTSAIANYIENAVAQRMNQQ